MRYRSNYFPALYFCLSIAGFFGGTGQAIHVRASFVPTPLGEVPDREARLLFNTGSRLYREKSWREAAQVFGDFLNRFPSHPDAQEAHYARGYSLNRLGRHAQAVIDLRAALKNEDARWAAEGSFFLGRSLEALAENESAGSQEHRSLLQSAAESYGKAARLYSSKSGEPSEESSGQKTSRLDLMMLALTSQGEILYKGGLYQEAVKALEPIPNQKTTLRRSPHYARGIYFLSLSHYALSQRSSGERRQGERAAAKNLLREFSEREFERNPFSEEALFLLARLHHGDGDRQDARDLYAKVAARGGTHAAEAAFYRAIALYESRTREALELAGKELETFLRDHSRHALAPRARFFEALCLFDLGNYGEAAKRLQAVISGGSTFGGQAWLRLAQSLLLKKPQDPEGALKVLENATTIFSQSSGQGDAGKAQLAEVLYWKGEAHLARGEEGFLGAIQAFREVADRYGGADPILAEKSLYQAAHASFLAKNRTLCAELSKRYRERYPRQRGQYYIESLKLSAENAYHASSGELDVEERKAVVKYYSEAALLSSDPTESRRLWYLSGLALYRQGDWKGSAEALGKVFEEHRKKPLSGFNEPDLPFYLADAVLQEARPENAGSQEKASWQRAASLLEEYLARSGKGTHAAAALANLGYCRQWLGDPEGARKCFESFLRAHPGHSLSSTVRFELANLHLVQGDLEAASREYARAAGESQDPLTKARAYLQAGIIQRRLRKPEEALQALGKIQSAALSQNAESEALIQNATYHRALALSETKGGDQARRELQTYLERFPGRPGEAEVRIQLAQLSLDEKDPRAALEALAPLIGAGPEQEGRDRALYHSAWCFQALWNEAQEKEESESDSGKNSQKKAEEFRKEMENSYRKLISAHPSSLLVPNAMVELAQHLFNRKEYAEAKKWFTAARKLLEEPVGPREEVPGAESARKPAGPVPTHLEQALFGLGFLSLQEEDYPSARELFDRVAERKESILAPRALFQAGRAWMQSQGNQEAADRFRRLIEEFPPRDREYREESFLRWGECLHRLGSYQESAKVLKQMVAEFSQGPLYHEGLFALGFAYQFLDDFDAARKTYRQVVASTAAVVAARAQYHLGECYLDQGDHRQAAREFLTVVANFDFEGPYRDWVRRSLLAAGIAYQAAGEAETARKQFLELERRFPDTDEGRAARRRLEEIKG